MEKLKLSHDRKVSPRSRWTKGGPKPIVPNAFGLPAGDSCPDKTEFCESCYADILQKCWTNVRKLVWHNFDLLKACGSNVNKMVNLLDEMVKSINWRGEPQLFRFMWDGDLFSRPFTAAVAETCRLNPGVQFWLYTRSFDFVGLLVDIPNLIVYLSVDEFNQKKAKQVYRKFPQLKIASCAETWDDTEKIMRSIVGRNAPKCPELTGKIPLVSEDGIGACVVCSCCIYGKNHIRFASKEKKNGKTKRVRKTS